MKSVIEGAEETILSSDYIKDKQGAPIPPPCEEKRNVLEFHIYALKRKGF